jgi:hypothetical protein
MDHAILVAPVAGDAKNRAAEVQPGHRSGSAQQQGRKMAAVGVLDVALPGIQDAVKQQ